MMGTKISEDLESTTTALKKEDREERELQQK